VKARFLVVLIVFCTLLAAGGEGLLYGDPGRDITSGRVNTRSKFSFQYGRIEARIKLPKTADGLWPAFWMLGEDLPAAGWPACGEIDILEMGGRRGIDTDNQERYFSGAAHWGSLENGGHPNYAVFTASEYGLQDGFHLYTLIWDEASLEMYLDLDAYPRAKPYFRMSLRADAGAYFQKPFFIIFNLAVGGVYPGIYESRGITALNAANNYEARMYVDFVKVYDTKGRLVWQDLFDAETLEASVWNIEENDEGGGNRELQSYRRENVSTGKEPSTGKNCLILSARRR
jgi:beta-glucanase (GH16 family)